MGRFQLTGSNCEGDVKIYSCINRQSCACQATASVGTEEGQDSQGWPVVIQHLLEHPGVGLHSAACLSCVQAGAVSVGGSVVAVGLDQLERGLGQVSI